MKYDSGTYIDNDGNDTDVLRNTRNIRTQSLLSEEENYSYSSNLEKAINGP
ncbi:hypothetical protein [Francisella philomiragia]|uniref:hypothetical protein n=1 Tax=Francisella philomiragia TaxID=28110 RepID=UPI001902CCEC|nr:hypothetical protein [Francisella philomiragia]MBK2297309.1 hypothetical protein [Francisella philomiragia]